MSWTVEASSSFLLAERTCSAPFSVHLNERAAERRVQAARQPGPRGRQAPPRRGPAQCAAPALLPPDFVHHYHFHQILFLCYPSQTPPCPLCPLRLLALAPPFLEPLPGSFFFLVSRIYINQVRIFSFLGPLSSSSSSSSPPPAPVLAEDAPHRYQDKFRLAEFTTSVTILSMLNVCAFLLTSDFPALLLSFQRLFLPPFSLRPTIFMN